LSASGIRLHCLIEHDCFVFQTRKANSAFCPIANPFPLAAQLRAMSGNFISQALAAARRAAPFPAGVITPLPQGFGISLPRSVGYPAPIPFRSALGSHCNMSV
jgi:hypothetical protein